MQEIFSPYKPYVPERRCLSCSEVSVEGTDKQDNSTWPQPSKAKEESCPLSLQTSFSLLPLLFLFLQPLFPPPFKRSLMSPSFLLLPPLSLPSSPFQFRPEIRKREGDFLFHFLFLLFFPFRLSYITRGKNGRHLIQPVESS